MTDAEAASFARDGFLILRGVLRGEELARLRAETLMIVEAGAAGPTGDPDYQYATGHVSGKPVLRRIEYPIDKQESCKVLLGHPDILRGVEKLQGPDFFPTWDAMVLKMPGEGIAVPWHRDAATEHAGDRPIFNVDFYLDEATPENGLWVYPGSQRWTVEDMERVTKQPGFSTEGAVPVPMQPGDVIFHDILLVHGSAASTTERLRRVVYYEFRPAHLEAATGPHTPAYIPLKQRVLMACLARRARTPYAAGEAPFVYRPPAPFADFGWTPGAEPPTYCYRHEHYWRKAG